MGRGPRTDGVGGHGQSPAGVVLEGVVLAAEAGEVGRGGGAVGECGDVVEVGAAGIGGAAGEATVTVASADRAGEAPIWAVGGGVVQGDGAGGWVVPSEADAGVGVGEPSGDCRVEDDPDAGVTDPQ